MRNIHHEEIKAWADGAEIERQVIPRGEIPIWIPCPHPTWKEEFVYRIKPRTKRLRLNLDRLIAMIESSEDITFDVEVDSYSTRIISIKGATIIPKR